MEKAKITKLFLVMFLAVLVIALIVAISDKDDENSEDETLTSNVAESFIDYETTESEYTTQKKAEEKTEIKTIITTENKTQKQSVESKQYWLPIVYKSYDAYGHIMYQAQWEYDEYGFIKQNIRNDRVFINMTTEFNGETVYLYDAEEPEDYIQYNFDTDGEIKETNFYFGEEVFPVGDEAKSYHYLWLDENGDIKPEYNVRGEVYYHPNTSVGYYEMDENEWFDTYRNDDMANLMLASVWKKAVFNSDGTATTTLYYKNGQVGEVIVWKSVTKQGFMQNNYSDADWDYGGTLAFLYKGK